MLNKKTNFIDTHPIGRIFKLGPKKAVWKKVSGLKSGLKIAIEKDGKLDWDEITSVKKVGRERVYDIEVEGTHNFVGNGILAHNTHISGTDMAEYYPTPPEASQDTIPLPGEVVTIGPPIGATVSAFTVVKATTEYDSKVIGVVSNDVSQSQVMGKDVLEWAETAVPVALTGRVPVKIATSSAEIKAGDFLTSSTEAGLAMKATGDGYTLGTALEDWTSASASATILVSLNNSVNINATLANATPSADLATRITNLEADTLLLKNQAALNKVTPDKFSVDTLSVSKDAFLPDTTIAGNLQATGNFTSSMGNLVLLNKGKVLGNDSFRGTAIIPANKDTIYIPQTWDTAPASITVTAGYDTTVWVENVTKDGFTIRVKNIPTTDNKIYWLGIW